MEYYNLTKINNNMVLSCDKLRLTFKVNQSIFNQFNRFIEQLSFNNMKYTYQLYTSTNIFSYRTMLNFKYLNSVVILGLCFNGVTNADFFNCFIEFNPNKSLVNSYATPIIDFIKSHCFDIALARYDMAIDIPIKRDFVYLRKDKRKYEKIYKLCQSANNLGSCTEYLGQRDNNGFVKLYNKTIESKLSYDLTRLEVTLTSFDYENMLNELPNVFYLKNIDLIESQSLSLTDRVFIMLLANSNNPLTYLNMLGRDKKEKYSKLLFEKICVSLTDNIYYSFISKIKSIYC